LGGSDCPLRRTAARKSSEHGAQAPLSHEHVFPGSETNSAGSHILEGQDNAETALGGAEVGEEGESQNTKRPKPCDSGRLYVVAGGVNPRPPGYECDPTPCSDAGVQESA